MEAWYRHRLLHRSECDRLTFYHDPAEPSAWEWEDAVQLNMCRNISNQIWITWKADIYWLLLRATFAGWQSSIWDTHELKRACWRRFVYANVGKAKRRANPPMSLVCDLCIPNINILFLICLLIGLMVGAYRTRLTGSRSFAELSAENCRRLK